MNSYEHKLVMDKYYYNDNILPYKNAIIKNEYNSFKIIWIGFLGVIWTILLILFIFYSRFLRKIVFYKFTIKQVPVPTCDSTVIVPPRLDTSCFV